MKKALGIMIILVIGLFSGGVVFAGQESRSAEVTILVYHTVEPKHNKKEGKMAKIYHIFPENFKAQMQYLKDNGYAPIPMKVYLDHIKWGTEIPAKSVVLTFDDGWRNQYDHAYPILKEFGYPATFYIITKSIGGSYMSWDQLRELDKAGMNIESHTETHANLTKVDEQKVRQELAGSKKTLEEKLGHAISMVAYPYYGNSPAVQKIVTEVGYKAARAGWTKSKNNQDTLFMLKSQEAVNNKNPFSSKIDK